MHTNADIFATKASSVSIDRGYGGLENAAALANGNYDIMFGDINSVILFNSKSPDHKLVSVFVIYDAYLGSVIVRKGSGITKPKDLEGKTIGAPLTTGGRTMFPAFAAANGVDESKVNWQTVSIQLQDQQFVQGQFDGVASFTTTSLLNLKQLGMNRDKVTIFNFCDYGVDLFGSGLIVRSDLIEKKPEVIQKFVRATLRGMKAMMENKVEAIEFLKKRDPLLNVPIEVDRLNLMIEMALKRPTVEKIRRRPRRSRAIAAQHRHHGDGVQDPADPEAPGGLQRQVPPGAVGTDAEVLRAVLGTRYVSGTGRACHADRSCHYGIAKARSALPLVPAHADRRSLRSAAAMAGCRIARAAASIW